MVTIRTLLSILSKRAFSEDDMGAMILDVKGAFLYGKTKRNVYIWLPPEDPKSQEGLMGKLNKAMYGTRDAPQVWQEEVRTTMTDMKFKECITQPGIYFQEDRQLQVVSHVDDFLCVGSKQSLRWFKEAVERKYEIKANMLDEQHREVTFLGRKIRWTEDGIEIEADTKHVEILLKEWDMEGCKSCDTPIGHEPEAEGEEMEARQATVFRRAVARINYLGQDRPDINVAARLLSMRMAKPKRGDEALVKRVLRYLKGHPRSAYVYPWNAETGSLEVYSDSDWGGDKDKRRSTSGGVILYGGHLVGHWSKLQNSPAPSSGEAELNASSKAVSEVLSIRHFLEQMGIPVRIRLYLDASAAKGTLLRRGAGKIKHLEIRQLWCQHAIERYQIEVTKIMRKSNLADCLTHVIGKREQSLFLEAIGVKITEEP